MSSSNGKYWLLVFLCTLLSLEKITIGFPAEVGNLLSITATNVRLPRQRKALVIGNAQYVHLSATSGSSNDADLVGRTLTSVGFSVKIVKDLNAKNMKKVLGDFFAQLSDSDVALVFYSGYGFRFDDDTRLLPVDYDPQIVRYEFEVEDSTLPLKDVLTALSSSGAKSKIVILDAFAASTDISPGGGLAVAHTLGDDTLVCYSSQADTSPVYNAGYTKILCEEILKHGITVEAAMLEVAHRMRDATHGQQTPWSYGNLAEDIYFDGSPAPTPTSIESGPSKHESLKSAKASLENFRSFMRWDVFPKDYKSFLEAFVVNGAVVGVIYFLFVLALYGISPANFAGLHEWIANRGIPFSENVSKILAPFLLDTPYCLNAVVRRYRQRARQLFDKAPEVKTRPKWVPAPLLLGDELLQDYQPPPAKRPGKPYVAGLQEIKARLGKGDERWTLSIEGPGGVGKSAFAFEIARWASDSRADYRLASFPMLPLLLESLGRGVDKAETVDAAAAAQLRFVMNVSKISDPLLQALLSRKRVLVVIDGVSEMPALIGQGAISPDSGAVAARALVVTSRLPTNLYESVVIRPQGLTLSFLDRVLDGLIAANVGSDRFNDDEREELRQHLRSLIEDARDGVKERQVPMIVLKLMIERADRLLKEKRQLDELPRTLSELVTDYTEQLLRNEPDIHFAMQQARTIAQVCVGKERRPAARSENRYAAKEVSKEVLDKFVTAGLMVRSGEKGDPFYKFALDPIAEQLDANRLVIDIREDRADQTELDELVRRWEDLPEDFVRALRRAAARYRQEICASNSAISLKLWPKGMEAEQEPLVRPALLPVIKGDSSESVSQEQSNGRASEIFAHFRILRHPDGSLWLLGRGATGHTYKAVDLTLNRPVALKIIAPRVLRNQQAMHRFLRQARAATLIEHPHVATVYGYGEKEDAFFYAMEFVDGEDLERYVARKEPLSPGTALRVVLQVAQGLGAAMTQRLTHRDIKPGNIIAVSTRADRFDVKLIDFALAKEVASETLDVENMTIGGFGGTPAFFSPEECEGKKVDIRSDIYSLGVTLWYLLLGNRPFTGSVGQVLTAIIVKPPPFDQLAHIPNPVVDLLRRMLAKNPDDRFQTPQQLQEAVEDALSLQAEPTAQQELEHRLSKAIAPEQPLALENLSGAAKALLSEILKDDRSGTKGVSFMFISETQGFYVPYLWDNHVHGALHFPMIDIATQRMAADELARKGVLNRFPRNNKLQQYALSPEFIPIA